MYPLPHAAAPQLHLHHGYLAQPRTVAPSELSSVLCVLGASGLMGALACTTLVLGVLALV